MEAARSFDDLAADAGEARPVLAELREHCMSLGSNVVEHVRMHRVVFGKSMAMRWFADVSPDGPAVVVRLNEGRRAEPTIISVRAGEDTGEAKKAIAAAYERA